MGQLVVGAASRWVLHVVIPRRVEQQDLLGHRVDDHQDVDVAAAGVEDFAPGVRAGDVKDKGILCHVDRLVRRRLFLDRHLVEQPCLFPEVRVILCIDQRIRVGLVQNDRLHVAFVERGHVVFHRFFRDRLDRLLDLSADLVHRLLGVVRVVAGHHAELVVLCALNRPGLVRLQHVNPFHCGNFIAGRGDRIHRRVGFRCESGRDRGADADDQCDDDRGNPAAVAFMTWAVACALEEQKRREYRQPSQNRVEHDQVFRRHHIQTVDVDNGNCFKQHLKQEHNTCQWAPSFSFPHNISSLLQTAGNRLAVAPCICKYSNYLPLAAAKMRALFAKIASRASSMPFF